MARLASNASNIQGGWMGREGQVGKRKNVYYGLWGTVAEVRGLNTTQPGQQIVRYLTGKSQALYGLDDAFRDRGALPSDFTPLASAPSLQDLDRAAGRNGIFPILKAPKR